MEKSMIGYCGLNCANCEAYQATQANDEAWKKRIAEQWRVEFNHPDLQASYVTCDGCHADGGRLGGYCLECDKRACGHARGLANCAECAEYDACEAIQSFIAAVIPAKENLEALRRR